MGVIFIAGDHAMKHVGASVVAFFVGTMLVSAAQYQGWLIPEGGRDEKSPMASVAGAAEPGRALYVSNCQ